VRAGGRRVPPQRSAVDCGTIVSCGQGSGIPGTTGRQSRRWKSSKGACWLEKRCVRERENSSGGGARGKDVLVNQDEDAASESSVVLGLGSGWEGGERVSLKTRACGCVRLDRVRKTTTERTAERTCAWVSSLLPLPVESRGRPRGTARRGQKRRPSPPRFSSGERKEREGEKERGK